MVKASPLFFIETLGKSMRYSDLSCKHMKFFESVLDLAETCESLSFLEIGSECMNFLETMPDFDETLHFFEFFWIPKQIYAILSNHARFYRYCATPLVSVPFSPFPAAFLPFLCKPSRAVHTFHKTQRCRLISDCFHPASAKTRRNTSTIPATCAWGVSGASLGSLDHFRPSPRSVRPRSIILRSYFDHSSIVLRSYFDRTSIILRLYFDLSSTVLGCWLCLGLQPNSCDLLWRGT